MEYQFEAQTTNKFIATVEAETLEDAKAAIKEIIENDGCGLNMVDMITEEADLKVNFDTLKPSEE